MSEKRYSSGELAALVGVSADTLRHYERKGVLHRPRRRSNGYREYPAQSLDRLRLVRRALAVGFTLDELAGILQAKERGGNPCAEVRELAASKLAGVETRLQELKKVRNELRSTLKEWDTRLAGRVGDERAHLLEHLPERSPAATAPRKNLRAKNQKEKK